MLADPAEIAKLEARMNTLEALVLMFSGILLAQAPDDPDHRKAVAVLDAVRAGAIARGRETGTERESTAAVDELLSLISENLGLLRRHL